jgi:hypothetical protein
MAGRAGFRPIRPPTVHVTSDFKKVVKRELKRVAKYMMKPQTEQYFEKI